MPTHESANYGGSGLTPIARRLVLSFILFYISLNLSVATFSNYGAVIGALFALFMVAYIIAYGLHCAGSRRVSAAHMRMFWYLSVVTFLLSLSICAATGQLTNLWIVVFLYTFSYLLVIVMLAFLAVLLFYFKDNRVRLLLLVAIIAIIVLYFGTGVTQYSADDETMIAAYSIKYLLSGVNPYTQSIFGVLYNMQVSHVIIGLTIGTGNSIVSVMDYPALYFLLQVPSYLMTNPILTPIELGMGFLHSQAVAFLFILMLAIGYLSKSQRDIRPQFLAYILLAISSLILASFIIYLMMALVLLLYTDLGRKYPWIILGIMASLQEQLWTFIILFALYYLNTYGIRKGLKQLAGAAAVFLTINCYFIIGSPASYFGNILTPLSTSFPSSSASIGYFLSSVYPIPLGAFSILFVASLVMIALVSLYINNSKLLPVLSMVPFMFMTHGLVLYYVLPMFVSAVLLYNGNIKEAKGWLRTFMDRSVQYAELLKGTAITGTAMIVLVVILSHAQWLAAFGVSAANQSATYVAYNSVTYHSDIAYNGTASGTSAYLLLLVTQNAQSTYFGLFNSSLTNRTICSYPCVNDNELELQKGSTYNLTVQIPANVANPTYISAVIYNSNYYYKSPPVRISG